MTKWLKNGKPIVDANGHPIDCPTCPCGSIECREAVDNAVNNLLTLKDEEQHYIWALQETYTPQYTCAVWTQDAETEEWSLVSMADGKLAVAFLVGKKVSDTAGSYARFLVYAKTLYSASLDQWLTVGCECHITGHECKHRMVSLTDFNVGGLLDVYKPEESDSTQSYEPSDACKADPCDVAKLKLQSAHDWHYGGTMHGEGFYDWWTDSRHRQQDWAMTKYLKALEWTDYEVDESDSEIHSIRMLTYIPCACDSENLVTHTLSSNEKLHSYSGICSMESNCQTQVLFRLRTLLDEEASDSDSEVPNLWEEVASVATDFVCAVFENGQCVSPSTGNLCIAFSRPSWLTYGSVDIYGVSLITGVTLRNTRTGRYRTIGCKCNYGDWSYWTCSQQFYEHDDVCIGGILPVAPDNCTERNACATYPCDVYSLAFQCYAEWYGCTLYGEGYLLHGNDFNNYDKFSMAITGFMNESDSSSTPQKWYYYIDCGCTTGHSGTGHSGVLLSNDSLEELAGLCSNPECENVLVLKKQAQAQGWTWYEEGVLTSLATCQKTDDSWVFGDWYNGYSAYMCCAESATHMFLVGCNCSGIRTIDKSRDEFIYNVPSGYWMYIEYEGACSCDNTMLARELYLTYPDIFGIEDISFGNHSKYYATTTSTCETYDEEQETYVEKTTTTETYDICSQIIHSQGNNMITITNNYIDYRTFCYIRKCFYSNDGYGYCVPKDCVQGVQVRWISPTGSPAGSWNYYSGERTYDTAEFVGHVQPFTRDNDIRSWDGGWDFAGYFVQWYAECNGSHNDGCFPTQAEADAFCASTMSQQPDCGTPYEVLSMSAPHLGVSRLSPPDYSYTQIPCTSFTCDYSPDRPYGVNGAYWEQGQKLYGETWVVYREQWIDTNLGLLRYGTGTYVPSFTRYGLDGAPPPPDPNQEFPMPDEGDYDRTITAQLIDTDMHGCDPDFEWNFDEDSESISEESESASN